MEEPKWFTDGVCDILERAEKTGFYQSGEEKVKGRGLQFAMELISTCR